MLLASLALTTAALLSAPATAPPTAVVATTAQGSTLAAADTKPEAGLDQLVLTLRGTDPEATESQTGRVPLWPDESVTVDHTDFSDDGLTAQVVVGGAVEADVATVELDYGDKVLRMSTVPGTGYTGRHAGEVRFFAGEIDLTLQEWAKNREQRVFDASGALLHAEGRNGTSRSVALLRRTVARTPIRFSATLEHYDDPLPLDLTHRTQELCLTVKTDTGELEARALAAACQDTPAGSQALRLGGLRGCGAEPTTLTGFVPAETRDVEVVLGSGRRERYGTRTTPFGLPERVLTAILPAREAIRTVTARDAAGRVLVRGNVGAAPPDRHCTTSGRSWGFLSDPPPVQLGLPAGTEVAESDAGGPRLLVREAADQVCVGVDALALDGSDCEEPPLSSRFAELLTKRYPDGRTAVGGVFAAKVSALSIRLADGTRVPVPVSESAGYTGHFHTALRFAFAVLAPGSPPVDGDVLDAAGHRIGTAEVDHCTCTKVRRFHTVMSRAGFRLTASGRGDDACISLAAGPRQPTYCQEYANDGAAADAIVTCTPRRTVVFGITPHGSRGVELRLDSGGDSSTPVRRYSGSGVFLAVFPPGVAVRRVRFLGVRGPSTVAMPLYGAARQCGYGFRGWL
jgi:hypothetical protein